MTTLEEDIGPKGAGSDASGHVLNLGRVDLVRVRVSYGRMLEGPEHDVFLLDLPGGGEEEEPFDEMPYLEALEPILYSDTETPSVYSVHVNRSHTSWGSGAGDVEIRMSLTTGLRATTKPAFQAVTDAFRRVLEHAGRLEPAAFGHDEAIASARTRVEEAYPAVHSDALRISSEEHRAAQGSWSVGLTTRDLDRYVVVVGFLDGYPGSAHVRHEPRSEVLDSLGSE